VNLNNSPILNTSRAGWHPAADWQSVLALIGHPTGWPWFVYVWVAFVLAVPIKSAWLWLQKKRAEKWPVEQARIEWVEIKKRRRGSFVSEIEYAYSVWGTSHIGRYKREFPTEYEAGEFARGLKGMPLVVRRNPAKAARSFVLEPDVEALLQQRDSTLPPDQTRPEKPLAPWLKTLLWPLALASLLGFLVSLWVHIGTWMGRTPGAHFWILHVGIFLVWLPAMFVSQSISKKQKDFWKILQKDFPPWMRYMAKGFFCYALINFLFCWISIAARREGTEALGWRLSSGHWMLFYLAAMGIHYVGARRNSAASA
jgi:hypothetical protein